MYTAILQPWSYLSAVSASGFAYLPQESTEYFDATPFDSVVFYLDLRAQSSVVSLAYETAPAKEDGLFKPMATLTNMSTLVGPTPTITVVQLSDGPSVPLARWVRWKLTFDAPGGDATFKITASFR